MRTHLVLPADETPYVAEVMDARTLKKSQPFYENAENGQYIIIYRSASRAILYDADRDIIVNVGTLEISP